MNCALSSYFEDFEDFNPHEYEMIHREVEEDQRIDEYIYNLLNIPMYDPVSEFFEEVEDLPTLNDKKITTMCQEVPKMMGPSMPQKSPVTVPLMLQKVTEQQQSKKGTLVPVPATTPTIRKNRDLPSKLARKNQIRNRLKIKSKSPPRKTKKSPPEKYKSSGIKFTIQGKTIEIQVNCCILDCERDKANRLMDSVRGKPPKMKKGYEHKRWTCICNYHYFSYLYAWKKRRKEEEKKIHTKKRVYFV